MEIYILKLTIFRLYEMNFGTDKISFQKHIVKKLGWNMTLSQILKFCLKKINFSKIETDISIPKHNLKNKTKTTLRCEKSSQILKIKFFKNLFKIF